MPTVLEIVDSAVKIGLGALISGVATYLVTTKNHQHDLRKASREDRRALIRSAAKLLEEGTTLMNQGTFAFQRGGGEGAAGVRLLIDGINKLGEAKSIAVLLGAKKLAAAITGLRGGLVELATSVGPDAQLFDPDKVNRLIVSMNQYWPAIHQELEAAYSLLSHDA